MVHSAGNQVGDIGYPPAESLCFDLSGQAQIIHYRRAYVFVSTNRQISLTTEQHHLSYRYGKERKSKLVRQCQWQKTKESPGKKGDQQPLPPGMYFLTGKTGQ